MIQKQVKSDLSEPTQKKRTTARQSQQHVQRKATVRPKNDRYEKEADRVADNVVQGKQLCAPIMRLSAQPERENERDRNTVQRMADDETVQRVTDEEAVQRMEEEVQRKAVGGMGAAATTAINSRGGGAQIQAGTRRTLEQRMGMDLGHVRVHEGAAAARSADSLNARAFTHKNHIWLGQGESQNNLRLMAHEATHTVQQTGQVQRKENAKEKEEGESAAAVAPGVIDFKGQPKLSASPAIAAWLDGQPQSTGMVRVRFGKIADGTVRVRKQKRKSADIFTLVGWQVVALTHPAFSAVQVGETTIRPSLIVKTKSDGTLTGHIGIPLGKAIPKSERALAKKLQEMPQMVGLGGFDFDRMPKLTNKLEGGALTLGMSEIPLKMGSIFNGTISLTANDERITSYEGNVNISVTGLAQGNMTLKRNPKGVVTGQAAVDLDLPKNFSGAVEVAWDGEKVAGKGKVGYQGEKLSGSVTLQLMKKSEAEKLEAAKKPPAEGALQKNKQKEKGDPYAVFGEGDLTFAFTDWLNGTAHVIIDHKGFVTIIGKITPQKEFTLFEQKPYHKPLPKVEARAAYGIPVVGNVFIFANIGLEAWAQLGPAKFYNIQVDGTYSTDPQKSNSFSIRGSLNISAAAGLTARGEAGAGVEIADHDIKIGAGINGTAGIKGYAEATPIIGYREKEGEQGADKQGEFFLRGEVEIAAQPFLGLSGDLFVELDSPWWSPAPDKKWTWPLGGKEWPLGGDMGIAADVDYVFGSGKPPAMKLKPAQFDGSKFMSDLTKKKTAPQSKKADKPGQWKEKNSKTAAPPKEAQQGDMQSGAPAPKPPAKAQVKGGRKKKKRGSQDKKVKGDAKKGVKKSPAHKVAQKTPITRSVHMLGVPHKLHLLPRPPYKLEMVSKRDLLSNKIGRQIGRLKQRPQNRMMQKRIADLMEIGKAAKRLQQKAKRDYENDPAYQVANLPGFDDLITLIETYARQHSASDIDVAVPTVSAIKKQLAAKAEAVQSRVKKVQAAVDFDADQWGYLRGDVVAYDKRVRSAMTLIKGVNSDDDKLLIEEELNEVERAVKPLEKTVATTTAQIGRFKAECKADRDRWHDKARWEKAKKAVRKILGEFKGGILHILPGATIRFRGSLATGWKGPHKLESTGAARRFKPSDFDCDMYIEIPNQMWSDELITTGAVTGDKKRVKLSQIRSWPRAEALRRLEARIISSHLSNVEGYRRADGEPDFNFTIQPETTYKGQREQGVVYPTGSIGKAGAGGVETTLPAGATREGATGSKMPERVEEI